MLGPIWSCRSRRELQFDPYNVSKDPIGCPIRPRQGTIIWLYISYVEPRWAKIAPCWDKIDFGPAFAYKTPARIKILADGGPVLRAAGGVGGPGLRLLRSQNLEAWLISTPFWTRPFHQGGLADTNRLRPVRRPPNNIFLIKCWPFSVS